MNLNIEDSIVEEVLTQALYESSAIFVDDIEDITDLLMKALKTVEEGFE